MEEELERKIFMLEDFENRTEMEKMADLYMKKLRNKYAYSRVIVTKEFYKNNNLLIRATRIGTRGRFDNNFKITKEELEREERKEREQRERDRLLDLSRGGRGRGRGRNR